MTVAIIIPAHNEEDTIGAVVKAAVEAGVGPVLVVNDGSHDRTVERAESAGATVISQSQNQGKGEAMLAGIVASVRTKADVYLFLDADLLGLRPDHVRSIVDAMAEDPHPAMVCGLRDYGPVVNRLQMGLPWITGERAVRAEVLDRVPESFWHGFRIEAGINRAAELTGRPTRAIILDGVSQRTKWAKTGEAGAERAAKMTLEVLEAIRDAKREIV